MAPRPWSRACVRWLRALPAPSPRRDGVRGGRRRSRQPVCELARELDLVPASACSSSTPPRQTDGGRQEGVRVQHRGRLRPAPGACAARRLLSARTLFVQSLEGGSPLYVGPLCRSGSKFGAATSSPHFRVAPSNRRDVVSAPSHPGSSSISPQTATTHQSLSNETETTRLTRRLGPSSLRSAPRLGRRARARAHPRAAGRARNVFHDITEPDSQPPAGTRGRPVTP